MNFSLILQMLRARWLLIVPTFLLSIGVAAYVTSKQQRTYLAWAPVVVNFDKETAFDRVGIPAQLSSSYMQTQMDILRSHRVALRVQQIADETPDRPAGLNFADIASDSLALELATNLRVEPGNNSRVVRIGFRSHDPAIAAFIANVYAQAYVDVVLELNTEPAKRKAEWFDAQLVIRRERLMEAEAVLTAFQQDNGIVALDERVDTENRRLNDLSSAYVEAQAETFDVISRQLGRNHPEYIRAQASEASLKRSLDKQKTKLLELRSLRDELGALTREAEIERENYRVLLQNYYRSSLEAEYENTNISLLSSAVVPTRPDTPNVRINLIGAAFLGLLLGFCLALLAESIGRRIRSNEDLSEGLGIEVLATVQTHGD